MTSNQKCIMHIVYKINAFVKTESEDLYRKKNICFKEMVL